MIREQEKKGFRFRIAYFHDNAYGINGVRRQQQRAVGIRIVRRSKLVRGGVRIACRVSVGVGGGLGARRQSRILVDVEQYGASGQSDRGGGRRFRSGQPER